MDENVLYKPSASTEVPSENSSNELKFQDNLPSSSPNSISKILKILLGIVVVLTVGFLIFGFLLPVIFKSIKPERVEIVYWGLGKELGVVGPLISDFEAKNPGIKIIYTNQDIKQYRERLLARTENRIGPDIFRFHNTWIPMLSSILLPIPENVTTNEDFSKNYYEVIKTDLRKSGAIYGIPLEIDTLSLYINKSLFEASGLDSPTTWIDFANYARQLTVKDENNKIKTAGAAMGGTVNIDHFSDIVSMLMAQNGVNIKDMSGNIEVSANALNFYTFFAIAPGNVWDETLETSLTAFANGSLAMYFGYARDYTLIKSLNPNLSFEIHPVPNLFDQKQTTASYWAEGVSSKSKHQKEAFVFLKYLSDKETQKKLFEEESKTMGIGRPFARIDLADSLKNNPNVYPFVSQAKDAVSSYFVDGTFDDGLNTKMNAALKSTIESILSGTSPQSAAENFSSDFSNILQEYSQAE